MTHNPTFVLLPGLMADAQLFAGQQPALSLLGRVHIADLTRSDNMADLARDVLSQAPGGPLVLIGLSMGGYVAFEIMRQAPERVAGMVLLDTSARPDSEEKVAERQELVAQARQNLATVIDAMLPRLSHPDFWCEPHVGGVVGIMARALGPEVFARQQQAIMTRPDSRPSLADIACPVLVVCGEDDVLTPPEVAREIADGIPGAMLALVKTCGHLSTLDQPQVVARLLTDWLSQHYSFPVRKAA